MTATNNQVLQELNARWNELLASYRVNQSVAEEEFEAIVTGYTEPHRYYHTLHHLYHLFTELDACQPISKETLWAVWYHDFVYQPGATTNEKKSTVRAAKFLNKLGADKSSIDRVITLINATKYHQSDFQDIELQFFLDADMAILGSDKEIYQDYCKAVRREHKSIPAMLFNRGRKKFLASVLAQPSIFMSDIFREKYELAARQNIEEELQLLP